MPAPFVGILKLNFNGQGCEERYVFTGGVTTHDQGLLKMQQIVWGRTGFLGENCEIIYARVSQLGPKADKRTCILPYPLGPHPSWANGVGVGDTLAPVNDPRTCVQMCEETAIGEYGQRYVRLIPDTWVVGNKLVAGVAPYFQEGPTFAPVADMSPAGNNTHLQICQSFWSYLRLNVALPKRNGPTDYNLRTIAAFVYQQITSKKMGKRFRLSAGKTLAS